MSEVVYSCWPPIDLHYPVLSKGERIASGLKVTTKHQQNSGNLFENNALQTPNKHDEFIIVFPMKEAINWYSLMLLC